MIQWKLVNSFNSLYVRNFCLNLNILALEAVEQNESKMVVDDSATKSMEDLDDIDKGCSSSSSAPTNVVLNTVNEERPREMYEDGDQLSPEQFHERLYVQTIESIDDVEKYYSDNFSMLTGQFGVLLCE